MDGRRFSPIVHGHGSSWHDGGVALLTADGEIVALAAERVGDRFKHSFDSRLAYEHLRGLDRYSGEFGGPRDFFIPVDKDLDGSDHHRFHAASSFFASGLEEAAILVVDGQGSMEGKLVPTSIWSGRGAELELLETLNPAEGKFAPGSIGHFYTAVGALAGLPGQSEEGKTMALAAYGGPSGILDWMRRYVGADEETGYRIDPDFVYAVLGHTLGPTLFEWGEQPEPVRRLWEEILAVMGRPVREPGTPVDQVDKDIAYAGQVLLEEMMLSLASRAREQTGSSRLCLAGGVALNCVANERLVREGGFDEVFIVPAPGDDGQALGKLLLEIRESGTDLDTTLRTAYLGPRYEEADFRDAAAQLEGEAEVRLLPEEELLRAVAELLAAGRVVAVCQGRSELGPRALGHRSILADPRRAEMRAHLNERVKDREWFRPLAPLVPEERAPAFFEMTGSCSFMTRAVPVRAAARGEIPSACHVDGTARVQTVRADQEPRIHRLLLEFERIAGVPVLINTSFNGPGQPIAETPEDAVRMFRAMNLDALLLGDALVVR